jgi:hypothetical protein
MICRHATGRPELVELHGDLVGVDLGRSEREASP